MQNQTGRLADAKKKRSILIALALASVYLFWGGTYLGMRFAVETIPPFLMAGVRFTAAGWILYAALRIKGEKRPTLLEWRDAGIVGTLMLLSGNGVVSWAEQSVPSSIASVLLATVPLWITVLSFLCGAKKPSAWSMLGIALGMCGIAALVWSPAGTASGESGLFGILAILFAAISWSAGSVYARKARMPAAPLLSTGMQMIVGGAALLVVAAFHGDYRGFDAAKVSVQSLLALGYLIVFGSLLGFTCYVWLLKNAEPSVAATYAFVNPIVAVFLGWLLAGEEIGANMLLAVVLIVAAVVVITLARDKGERARAGEEQNAPGAAGAEPVLPAEKGGR
ncbi:MAG TPA: drug/metabolite exporter YedA [Clostridia bacterium]|nr:MAG: putative inner membrane transporter YedA [Firmicutes bacterium ADurb.Bin248]HOG02137.1 drug/metabolite exporter YedA [Clostridia bacterium]HOS19161.1 drug/metabolite exporter YedA [Clostridia bacterium]HPK15575.1 drug/metabolite exporter YedA [Clostridia bacterium]